MKSKIYKIMGVTLALVLALSLFGMFVPANQAEVEAQGYVPNQWNVYPTPVPGPPRKLLPGEDIADIAVANDGKTVWAALALGVWNPVTRTTSEGRIWSTIATLATTPNFAGPGAKLVAVAPDDPTVAAVVATSAGPDGTPGTADDCDGIFYTANNGATWSFMGDTSPWGGANEIITDIAIGPARSGPLLGRDIVISTANILQNTFGDIYVVTGPIWQSLSAGPDQILGNADDLWGAGVGTAFDFTSLAMAPNWLGDRVVVAVGSGNGGLIADTNDTSGVTGDTHLFMFNVAPLDTSPPGPATVIPPSPVTIEAAGSDSPPELWVGAWPPPAFTPPSGIVCSSIVLPSDWDSTTAMGRRTWVGWTSVNPAAPPPTYSDDVYRIDNSSVRKLELAAQVSINSLAYSGTIASGVLFAGERVGAAGTAPAMVWYTDDPQSSVPTWQYSFKPPTGALGAGADTTAGTFDDPNVIVAVAPDFPESQKVYAATNDGAATTDSAFSVSWNGGVSFNQTGLIDTPAPTLRDIMPVPDGSVIFLATDDGLGSVSLWKSEVVPPDVDTWDRVLLVPAAGANPFGSPASQIRISPEWSDDHTIYWFDTGAGSAGLIMRSVDGSDVFATRASPVGIADATVESKDVLYVGDVGSNLVRRSTNGAWFFDLPIGAAVAAVNNINMLPSYPEKPVPGNLVVGGTLGGVCISLNGGQSFIPLGPGVPGGTLQQVIGDVDWANNSTVYAGDINGTGIWRFQFGTSTAWESIDNLAAGLPGPDNIVPSLDDIPAPIAVTGLAMSSGILYGSFFEPTLPYSGAERSLVPDIPVIAAWLFQSMDVGSAGTRFNTAPSALRTAETEDAVHLYAIDTLGNALFGYNDTMAKAKPDLDVPDVVPIDSVTGRNTQFIIKWPQVSNATNFQVEIYSDPACSQLVTWAGAPAPAPVAWAASDPLSPAWVVLANTPGLLAGQEYFVKARARNQMPGDAINSPWSSVYRFEVQAGERVEVSYLGVQPLGPACGATDAPVSPGFTWSPYGGATRYEFQLANDAGFTDIVAEAKVSATGYKYEGTLTEGATYFWRVRGIEPSVTDWSPVCSFTVAKAPPPPVVVEEAPPPPPAPEPVVTPAIIWAIIGIGAILVIAVIVLIVRTRRAA